MAIDVDTGRDQVEHPMMPQRSHDDAARIRSVRSLRQSLLPKLAAGSREMYYRGVETRLAERLGRPPEDWREIRDAMTGIDYVKFQLGTQRSIQEMMFETLVDHVEPQAPALARRAAAIPTRLGSLTLDPDLVVPRYVSAVDIHCQPGGYALEAFPGDVAAGAIYDRAINMYQAGRGGMADGAGKAVIALLAAGWPGFVPGRVLDMGCTIGQSTTAYCDHWPEAEVHGIDVAAACLRYGHARAEALGRAIHFSQQNAEATRFPDGHFDLIASNILAHETSTSAWPAINRECYRLLRPGGMMVHGDLPTFAEIDPYRRFIYANEAYHNNEPFWTKYRSLDPVQIAIDAGFRPENVYRDFSAVRAGTDRAKAEAAVAASRALGEGAPPGSGLGIAYVVAIRD